MRTSQIFRIHKTKRIKTIGHSRLQGHVQHSSRQCAAGMLVGQPAAGRWDVFCSVQQFALRHGRRRWEAKKGNNRTAKTELRRELRKRRETGDCEETTRSSSVRCVVLGCARSWAEPEEASLFIFCIFGRGGCGPVWPPCSSLCGMPWEKRHALVASLSEELGQVHE